MVVTGSFIAGTPETGALPVDVVGAAELAQRGSPSMVQFIKTIPSSGAVIGENNRFGSGSGGAGQGDAPPTELTRSSNLRCADPGLDRDGDAYVAFCTARSDRFYTSHDRVAWEGHDMAIVFPSWVDTSAAVWAYEPETIDGRWYL